jgi:23S rRNA pseudouridine2457 synthase
LNFSYFKFYKPYGVLSQFSDEDGNPGLGRFLELQKDIYSVGRLDKDSEGLLLLTNDNKLKHRLLLPEEGHLRTYWVQVEGAITSEAIQELNNPVLLNFKGKKYLTRSGSASAIEPGELPERVPPVRYRKQIPTSWLSISLTEGKNRQVRKMTAAVGFPTLRLIRVQFGSVLLGNLKPGEIQPLNETELHELIHSSK